MRQILRQKFSEGSNPSLYSYVRVSKRRIQRGHFSVAKFKSILLLEQNENVFPNPSFLVTDSCPSLNLFFLISSSECFYVSSAFFDIFSLDQKSK